MSSTTSAPPPVTTTLPVSKAAFWTGCILSTLPVLLLIMSAVMKFLKPAPVIEGFAKSGFKTELLFPLGIVEAVCTLLYIIPRTSVLGAILLTGYLGGAICTHVRVDEPFIVQFLLGVALWLGLYLRDRRLRALIPFRSL